ncbi:MAG: CcmD family protein [Acidobacteriota bacterium]|jgi:CcmD family protein
MDDATTISDAVKIAFAAVNFLVWTGLFLYLLRLNGKIRRLEAIGTGDRETES